MAANPMFAALGQRLPLLAAALWWGSLSVIGFMAVPLLFANLPTRMQAGNMAAHLFAAQTYVSMACCLCLLICAKSRHAAREYDWARDALVFVIAGLLLALLIQYGVAPRIVARQNLKLWHPAGSLMYALQWLCALATLWRLGRR
ncbi:hypothetical protein GCM10022279_19440 [Comamonas faecalis]|uniref:TMEM205-like domain-containing protein n=1 Tax=Comamonas faecalis TaxID=1387849 RepID=A0ABP7RDG5_9BURK